MEKEPWEGLDIDDSDLSTFIRPCNRRRNPPADSRRPPIPGPAGAVQAAMIHRRTSANEPLIPTQDPTFHSNAWLSASPFVNSATPLRTIKSHLNFERVDLVVAVVKSCNPNGFGDAMITLKDPTGTIGASIHRKVFTESEFAKDITVGCVLILQKVVVFSPTSSTCYLNITLPNIIKIIASDCGPPSGQASSSTSHKADLDFDFGDDFEDITKD